MKHSNRPLAPLGAFLLVAALAGCSDIPPEPADGPGQDPDRIMPAAAPDEGRQDGFFGSRIYLENRSSGGQQVRVHYFSSLSQDSTVDAVGSEDLGPDQFLHVPDADMITISAPGGGRVAVWNDSLDDAELWLFAETGGRRNYIDFIPPPDAQGSFSYKWQISPAEVYRFVVVASLER